MTLEELRKKKQQEEAQLRKENEAAAKRARQKAKKQNSVSIGAQKPQNGIAGTSFAAEAAAKEKKTRQTKQQQANLAKRKAERENSLGVGRGTTYSGIESSDWKSQQERSIEREKENAAKMRKNVIEQKRAEVAAGNVARANLGAKSGAGNWVENRENRELKAKAEAMTDDGLSPMQRAQNQRSESMAQSYYSAKDFLENAQYDDPLDNVLFGVMSDWATAGGEMAQNFGKNVGEMLSDDSHQDVYVTPAMAQQTARGNTVARALGIETEELKPFSTIEGGEKADTDFNNRLKSWGERLIDAYSGGDPNMLDVEKVAENSDAAYAAAKAQAKTPVGELTIDAVQVINDMVMTLVISKGTGMSISNIYAFRGGNETMQEMIEEGYDTEEAFAAGLASAGLSKMVESGFGFGKTDGGLIDSATKKIGNAAVKFLGKYVPGDKVAYAIEAASGILSKPILGRAIKATGGTLGEGLEEGLEYNLTYVLDTLFGREDVSYEVKEMLYSMLLGAIGGFAFEGANGFIDYKTDPTVGLSNDTRQTIEAEKIIEYLDGLDPDILSKAVTGDLNGMEAMMKGLDYEQLNENGQKLYREMEIVRKFEENVKPEDYEAVKDIPT